MRLRSAAILVLALVVLSAPALAQTWQEQIDAALRRKVSYDLNNIAVADVFRLLSQDADVNIILDSPATVDPTFRITFAAKDMTLAAVLNWVSRLAGLEWLVQDEAIFITKYQRLSESARRQIEARNIASRNAALKTWLPSMQEALARKISVSFVQKSIPDCRESLKVLLGINIVVSPAIDPKTGVVLAVSKMTAENVLSWVARKAGIDFAVIDEAVYFAPSEEIRIIRNYGLDLSSQGRVQNMISFEFDDEPLDIAIDTLAKKSGVRILLRGCPEPVPRLSLSGTDMPLSAALQAVVSKTGLNNAILPEGDTIVVSIIKAAPPKTVPPPVPVPSAEPPVETPVEKPVEMPVETLDQPQRDSSANTGT